ncbi:MAG: hypothetical protein K0S25_1120 [Bacillus sp. (in: firmicutes)]|jgi:hypothetical protein|nr:hypothetical protein [Bacillus sp. (in: firmicutes)]
MIKQITMRITQKFFGEMRYFLSYFIWKVAAEVASQSQ